MLDFEGWYALARNDPARLLTLVRTRAVPAHELSWAIEALGVVQLDSALDLLFELVEDADPRVRLGAAHGLMYHSGATTIRMWLEKIAATDPDPEVREALEGFL